MNKLLVTVGAAAVAATCQAGIKYWDNQDYKAYDANDYVPGAVWNLDGIDNAGTGTHDYTATTWKNLGSSGANNDVWVRYQKSGGGWANSSAPSSLDPVSGKNLGSWTENGFTFTGDSEWRAAGSDSVARIETGTDYTIQALVTANVSSQKYSWVYLMSVQKDHFAFALDKSAGKLYWKTQNATTDNHPFMSGNDLGYMTAILNATDKTATFFSGTTIPTAGDGFRQYSSVSGKSDNGYCICGYTGNDCMFVGTIHSYRYYKRVLTEEELAWNRVVDERRFFDRSAPLPVTNVVVATAVAGATGAEPAGCYAVDGRHIFIAPATVNVSGIDYVCTGYTVETRSGDGWSEPVFHKAALYQPCAFVVSEGDCVRLTWQWAKAAGLKNLGYTVHDYVWDGLEVFYDGICNQGTNVAHSYTATTWVNLGSIGYTNDVFVQRLNAAGTGWEAAADLNPVGERDPGYWTENGFRMDAESRFRCNAPGHFTVGTSYSLQMLIDAKASDQVTANAFPLGANNENFAFQLRKDDKQLYWKYTDTGYPFLSGDKYDYVTAIMHEDDRQTVFTGTTEPTSGNGYKTKSSRGYSDTGFCLGGYGKTLVNDLFVGTLKSLRQYDHALSAEEVAQNRKVDNWRYFGIPDNPDVIVQSTIPYLRGDEPDGPYAVDGSHVFTAPATVTAKGIEYACAGYTIETWNDGAWSGSVSSSSCSYAYNTSAGLVRLTWRWRPVRGLRTAADYSYADYSQAGLYWHYDGLFNQGVDVERSTAANATWVNLGSAGATYDMVKYNVNSSKPDGEWGEDGYIFRGGTRFRVVGKPIGPFKSFSLQTLVDANISDQTSSTDCYIMSGIWDYFSILIYKGTNAYADSLCCYFQGRGSSTETAVYFKNSSGNYDYATSIMDYDAKTAQVFGGVEAPTSGTGFHQFDSVSTRSDSGFGLGNSGGAGTEGLVGTLKSFRYYDRVLTEEEIVRNRNVDAVRYFGALGVTNVLVRTKYGDGTGETLAEEPGAYKVEGSWTFSATCVKDENGTLSPVAGYYTEELVDGTWANKAWHVGQEYTYEEATANGKTIRLTWSAPLPGMKITIR